VFRSAAIDIKSPKELTLLRAAGLAASEVLAFVAARVAPGVSTAELDELAASEISRRKGKPAFLGYRGYPASLCVSINDEVVHGIPRKDRFVREGDIVGLDFGCVLKGYYGDCAVTVPAGRISDKARRLMDVTRESLGKAIEQMRQDRRLGDVSSAVQSHVEAAGFSVVREFVGHGIGRALHEDPAVPNFGQPGTGPRLRPGMVLALEPMVNEGVSDVKVLGDQWTAVTCDGALSAHFEHMVAVTEDGPEILTKNG